jgi:hypothetical protein
MPARSHFYQNVNIILTNLRYGDGMSTGPNSDISRAPALGHSAGEVEPAGPEEHVLPKELLKDAQLDSSHLAAIGTGEKIEETASGMDVSELYAAHLETYATDMASSLGVRADFSSASLENLSEAVQCLSTLSAQDVSQTELCNFTAPVASMAETRVASVGLLGA